ncbi:type VI secretion system Vgr family protein [Variovorax sp. dw_954]|uniref:type VI secretion system tip protein VgrG n=1 Tax=Variovorax sp. dw_954 TaxID=2720078 RepID=UPI001BD2F80F
MPRRFFSFGFDQRKRLISLAFPHDDAPKVTDTHGRQGDVNIVIDRLEAEEALSQDFRYTLHLLADNARLKLKDMLGKLLVVSLVRPDGSLRYFTGYCFEFTLVKADDGVARYLAVLRPWLHYLTLRSNNRVFLAQTLEDQTATIFADYGALPQWQWLAPREDPQVTMACQGGGAGETDANYLHARWEALGMAYRYEHTQAGHTLVLTGDTTIGPAIDGDSPEIRFHTAGGPRR